MAYLPLNPVITPFTPDEIESTFPCVDCFNSDKERWAIIVYVLWRILNGAQATFSADAVNSDCACFKCIMEEPKLMEALIIILAAYAVQINVVPAVPATSDAACLMCEDVLTLKQQALCLFGHWINSLRLPL